MPPLPLANLGGSRLKLGHFGVETFRLLGVARQFCAVRAEEAHEGPSGSRLPRAVPRSRSRGVPAPQGNARRRALEDGAQQSSTGRSVELARAPLPTALQRKYPGATLRIFARRSSVASVGLRRPFSKWLRYPENVARLLTNQLFARAQQVAHLLGLRIRHEARPDQTVRQ